MTSTLLHPAPSLFQKDDAPQSLQSRKRRVARACTRLRMQQATKALRALRRHLEALCRARQAALEGER